MPGPCPTSERLAAAVRGEVGHDAELAAHLSECSACQAEIEKLAGGSGWLEAKVRTHAASPTSAPGALRVGMQRLESHGGSSDPETTGPPGLDFLQPSDQPGILGRFGPYEIIAPIASGGMGIVLKAREPALDRVVALKILAPALAANGLARARFVREARAAAAVVHEHVVPIYAVAEFAGLPYLVMQFIEGRSLAERIRLTGPLRLEEILRIGAQTAAGLAAAHAQGLVHRDVKPGNILLENSVERVKLTDFGLARAVDDAGLTRTGELAGTPEFMSPEQAGNEAVDHRSDLFSFGSVLYAMCTGVSPFQATSVIAAVRKVCDARPPAVHEVNCAIPRWFGEIVARLMAKRADDRFQSAREIGELLERYLARVQHGDLAPLSDREPRRTPIKRRWSIIFAGVIVLALTTLGVILRGPVDPPSLPAASQPAATSEVPFLVRDPAGDTVGSYQDILEAIGAASSGGVIELHWNGTRSMPPVTIAAKPLTLRAGEMFHPTWLHTNAQECALAADAALTLEGIDFVMKASAENPPGQGEDRERRRLDGRSGFRAPLWHSSPSGSALIAVTNGSLRILQCLLRLEGPGKDRVRLACVIAENAASCEFTSTALSSTPGKAIIWRSRPESPPGAQTNSADHASSMSMSNCVVDGAPAFSIEAGESSACNLQIFRSTFIGPAAVLFPLTASTGIVTFVAQNNLFAAGTVLRDLRRTASSRTTMRWRERENLFHASQGYIDLPGSPRAARSLAEWNTWWMQTNQNCRQVNVEFVRGRRSGRAADSEYHPSMFTVTNVSVLDGPPLDPDQWDRFGANIADVGPAAAK